jgi:perosamine synthetase
MSKKHTLDDYLIDAAVTVQEALIKMNDSGLGVVFLHSHRKIAGVLTDGDLRRSLLNGIELSDPALSIATRDFVSGAVTDEPFTLYGKFSDSVKKIPVLNEFGEIVRVASVQELGLIPLAEPNLGTRERELVLKTLETNWISSTGSFVSEFESLFGKYVGSKYAVAVSNGTQALALAMHSLGIGKDDEVLVPAFTFGATANSVIQVGAIPVFVDVEKDTFGIDPHQLKRSLSSKTRAIVVAHLYGKPAQIQKIMTFAAENNLFVIEDCAEAIGSLVDNLHVGTFGDAAAFSFFANKTLTTGEGGIVIFKDHEPFKLAMKIRSHGFSNSKKYWHEVWGTNMRLTNLQAAIGVAQVERVEELVERKIEIGESYTKNFEQLNQFDLELPKSFENEINSYWLYTMLLPNSIDPKDVVEYLSKYGIESRTLFFPLPRQPAFQIHDRTISFPIAEEVHKRGISLPSSTKITNSELEYVARKLIDYLKLNVN